MVSAIRDSSLDYRTYWLQGGQYYERRPLEGLGAACELPADKLRQIPEADRKVLLDEVNADASFCKKIARCMATEPNCIRLISTAMREAVVNEMDPSKFTGRAGTWPKLRAKVRSIIDEAVPAIEKAVAAMPFRKKIEIVKSIASGGSAAPKLSGLGAAGVFDLIGGIFGGVGDYFGSRVIEDAKRDIAATNANAAINLANAQITIANANAAIAAAQERMSNPISSTISTLTTSTVAGIPIIIPILGAVGLVLYFIFK